MSEQVWMGILGLGGSLLAIASVVVTYTLQERRARREARERAQQREWDLQDRAEARLRSEARATEVTGTVLKAVDANTELTKKAAEAATAAHDKIEAVGAVRITDKTKRSTDGETQ